MTVVIVLGGIRRGVWFETQADFDAFATGVPVKSLLFVETSPRLKAKAPRAQGTPLKIATPEEWSHLLDGAILTHIKGAVG